MTPDPDFARFEREVREDYRRRLFCAPTCPVCGGPVIFQPEDGELVCARCRPPLCVGDEA